MKTYSIDKITRYFKPLDPEENDEIVDTMICNQKWLVFDDENPGIEYFFKNDHVLVISENGNQVGVSKWVTIKYFHGLFIVDEKLTSYTMIPLFADDHIIVLKRVETNEISFLINPSAKDLFMLDSIANILHYFDI